MKEFGLYFDIGYHHIANLQGLDHILFIVALCIRYTFNDWRRLLLLVSSFTIGHSLTLALSVFDLVHVPTAWVEFAIPLTIMVSALSNLTVKKFNYKNKYPFIYFLALAFGLVHGLGFSNYLKSLLGRGQHLFVPLLAFNTGLEVGQILVVCIVLLFTLICINAFKINRREYIIFVSGGVAGMALQMALLRSPF